MGNNKPKNTELKDQSSFKSGIPQQVISQSNKTGSASSSQPKTTKTKISIKPSFFKNIFKKDNNKPLSSKPKKTSDNPELEKINLQTAAAEEDLAKKTKLFIEKRKLIKTRLKEQKLEVKQLWQEHKKEQKTLNDLKNKYSKRIVLKHEIIPYFTPKKPDLKENIIELNNIYKYYIIGSIKNVIINNVNLKIKKEQIITILGPSGSGKTTLLNLMSGLDTVNRGDVFVDGFNLSLLKDSDLTLFRREKIAFIFQQYNLLPHLTAKENAEVGENLANKKNPSLSLNKIFETIEMTDHMDKYPYQLSGGQQQRISIARALAKNPAILFCDEPTGALDEKTGKKVLEILVKINKEFKTTIIIVTHNPNISEISDYVIKIHDGQIDDQFQNKIKKAPKEIIWA